MKIEKVNLVYFSPTKSTKKIVNSIAASFNTEIVDYDYTHKINSKDVPSFGSNELVIIGSPVYGGRVAGVAESFFKSLKGNNTPVVPVVVYGNRDFEDALLELSDYLKENNFKMIGAGAFVAEHSYGREIAGGRPDTEDINIAKLLGEEIKKRLESVTDLSEIQEIKVSGNHPYKERPPVGEPWAPITTDDCTECGICVSACPMAIVSPKNPREITNSQLCIHCCSCIKACPYDAKLFTAEPYKKIKQFLLDNCSSVNKKPKLFI
ncbi:Flavodoxin [Desulfonispora thiosulfatigenes DSM 11270]|uniref:Ferredoxin n=1 Tax=Desulfonispora thiosulfatigenes DSM 11270 TaxID=656914 RepID=A0A1W1VF93_DESTI|nr:4Fe-4S binding protein [Desulfonispora thiosulfatigenes]SMB92022.1 Flavodoxin [Desulfonispora thiosulfatigenes DSM 11270]